MERPATQAGWVSIPCLAAGIVAAGWLTSGSDTQSKLQAIAVATLVVQAAIAVALGYVAFRRIMRVSPWPTVVLTLPGLAAAVAAALAGTATYQLVEASLNRLLDLAVTGTAATTAAVVVLLALDRQARTIAGRLLARVRRRSAPAGS